MKPNVINLKRDLNKMIKFSPVDENGLKEFLIGEKGFPLRSVNQQIGKLQESYKEHQIVKIKASPAAKRATTPKTKSAPAKKEAATKSKAAEPKAKVAPPNTKAANNKKTTAEKTPKSKSASPKKTTTPKKAKKITEKM